MASVEFILGQRARSNLEFHCNILIRICYSDRNQKDSSRPKANIKEFELLARVMQKIMTRLNKPDCLL
jgi:hypothetical protein